MIKHVLAFIGGAVVVMYVAGVLGFGHVKIYWTAKEYVCTEKTQ